MVFKIHEVKNVENFIIENNIVKGVEDEAIIDLQDACNIGQIFLDTLNSKPNHVAQIDAERDKQTTFAEMMNRSVRCGIWLKKQGIGSGDIVTLCSDNHIDTCIPMLATYYAGAIFNAWNHDIALKPAQYLMQLIQPKVIFCCETAADILLEAAKLENVDTTIIVFAHHSSLQTFNYIMQLSSHEDIVTFKPEKVESPKKTIGLIILSSGTTGLAKGVMHSYETVLKILTWFFPYSISCKMLWYTTPYWITGYAFTLQNILSYGTRIIHAKFDVEETCRVIEKYKIQRLLISPLMIPYFCKSNALKKYNISSLEYVFMGGCKPNSQQFKEFKMNLKNVPVYQGYGLSEAGRIVIMQTKNSKNITSVGFVLPGVQVKIVDVQTNKTLGTNEPGEIYVKTPTIMLGYYKNPEATKDITEEGWLHTGDLGYYDENGEIFITDRIKDVMKCRYHHVSPTEIEEILLSHPAVMEAAVVPIPHELDGERPLAFIKKVPEANVTEEELIKLSSTLGEMKTLHGGVRFVDNLPKTASGKLARAYLRDKAKELA